MTQGSVRMNQNQKLNRSESPKAAVQLRYSKFASPHRARATNGPAATAALLPRLLALVRVREEGQRGGSCITITIDDGYGRVSRGRETIWDKKRTADVRFIRFGRGQVRDEWGHAAYWVRLRRDGRSGDSSNSNLSRLRRESVGMECCAVRSGYL